MDNNTLESLLAKQAITEVIHRYARAIDRLDESLLRSVFHPGSSHNHFYQGPSSAPDRAAEGDDPGVLDAELEGLIGGQEPTHLVCGEADPRVAVHVVAGPARRGRVRPDDVLGLVVDEEVRVDERLAVVDGGQDAGRRLVEQLADPRLIGHGAVTPAHGGPRIVLPAHSLRRASRG